MKETNHRSVRSWYMYDWANSPFITCVTGVILQAYYLTLFSDCENVEVTVFGCIRHANVNIYGHFYLFCCCGICHADDYRTGILDSGRLTRTGARGDTGHESVIVRFHDT